MKNVSSRVKQEQYFRTDHLKDDLKGRSVRGGAVTMAAQFSKFVLQMSSTVFLARLLAPEDYGLIGMVTVVIGFAGLFKDLGLSTATIQKSEINHNQVSTLFWINFVISCTTALVVAGLAPVVAWFYKEPRLTWITLALATSFIFSGLTVQHQALLRRQMSFTSLAKIEVISMLVGVVTALISAWYGLGYWALVLMQIATAIANAVGVWVACSWRPGVLLRRSGIGSMLAFGGNLTGFSIANYFSRNLDNVLIGQYWGAQQLGLYAQAYKLLLLPLNQINAPIGAVAIPGLSRLQNKPEQFRQYYLKALSVAAFLTIPTVILIVIISEEVIELLLGSQWIDASKIFRFLAVSGIIQIICNTSGWLYISTGRTKQMFKWGLFASPFIMISFFIGLPYGGNGVAFSYTVAMYLQALPCMYYAIKKTAITLFDIWSAISQCLISSLISGILVFIFKILVVPQLPIWLIAALCSFIMCIAYLGIMFYLFNKREFYLSIMSTLISRKA